MRGHRLMRRLWLDETTETWWDDSDFMRRLRLDETTETWWDKWDLMRRLRLMRTLRLNETTEIWWDDWDWWEHWNLMWQLRIRIGFLLNHAWLNYLIPNEIISSTIVYDQDAHHSRRFTLAEFGASLNFIAICFIQYFLFVDTWTFTWNCLRIFKKQRLDERTESWWYNRDLMRRLRLMRGLRLDETTEI